jgi:hypothetical protein
VRWSQVACAVATLKEPARPPIPGRPKNFLLGDWRAAYNVIYRDPCKRQNAMCQPTDNVGTSKVFLCTAQHNPAGVAFTKTPEACDADRELESLDASAVTID